MKLLNIKAHGFKSFADKIDINVGMGITGIVGPNGSGKSNVVDAVKWVLGENSLKELRGGDTQSDVIFMGSQTRNPLTHAWVSLTFDNSDHYLQTDLTTVEIKREVYKTGENEYFINNSKVRKKDITDLFLDSGASSNSFSIISQGKIVEVLKGKSTDRRVIIEEAAGVLKYKKRKEDTERKLEQANDNLEKVSLVINELEVNLEPLRRQAEDARKYLDYKDELKSIEVSLLASDIKKINEEEKKLKEDLKNANDQLLNVDKSSTLETTKLEKMKLDSIKLDESISSLSDEIMNLTDKISSLDVSKQVLSERKKYQVDDMKLENNILMLKEDEINYKKNITLKTNELKKLSKELSLVEENLANINNEYKNLNTKKNTLLNVLSSKSKQELITKNKIDNLNDILDNDAHLPYAVKSVLNNPRLKGIHDTLGNVLDINEMYAISLDVALGANQNVIICDDPASASQAIEYLKDSKLGRVTFFPISIIKSRYINDADLAICKSVAGFIDVLSNLVSYNPLYQGIVNNQLGNTLIVNNIDTMNILGKKLDYRYRIITLDGELLHTGGALTGGINKKSNGLINTKFELDKLNSEYDILIREEKNIELDINQTDEDLKILENKVMEINIDVTNKKEQINYLESNINDLKEKLDSIEKEIKGTENILNDSVDNELNSILNEYLEVSTLKENKLSELNELKTNKSELLSSINELENINRIKNSEYNKKVSEIKDLEININKLDMKMDNYLNRLNEEYELTYDKASTYLLEMDEEVARTKVNLLKKNIRELGEVNVGSISEYDRINKRYTFLTNQKNDIEGAILDLNNIISDLDEEMKNKFEETFYKVNEEFKKVFKKLFKGGNSELTLTNPDDMLLTGVDICACPPGKSLKNISALSGGEMTLTAIALLFSILNVCKVPFCILDEVEAALDEANVDQFGTYLKEYDETSQFIVITHKKRTMEYANTLYGITMQESGVSKLVSVKLDEVN